VIFVCITENIMLLSGKLFKIFLFFRGETMELLKTMASPFQKLFSFSQNEGAPAKHEPPRGLSDYECRLILEARRRENERLVQKAGPKK